MTDVLMSTKDLMELFGVGANTITKWCRQGRLPAPVSRNRNGYQWYRSSIEAVMNLQRQRSERNCTFYKRHVRV